MDHIDAIVEKIRDAIVGDLRKEFTNLRLKSGDSLRGCRDSSTASELQLKL
jgi:hypothetical protein